MPVTETGDCARNCHEQDKKEAKEESDLLE